MVQARKHSTRQYKERWCQGRTLKCDFECKLRKEARGRRPDLNLEDKIRWKSIERRRQTKNYSQLASI